jgi:hypothetical protein
MLPREAILSVQLCVANSAVQSISLAQFSSFSGDGTIAITNNTSSINNSSWILADENDKCIAWSAKSFFDDDL